MNPKHLNKEQMIADANHAIAICKPCFIINYNCEFDGYKFDIVPLKNHTHNGSFEDHCKYAIKYAFAAGGWSDIVIVAKLDKKRKAYLESVIVAEMLDWFREHGDDAKVNFDGKEFEMTYKLKEEAA